MPLRDDLLEPIPGDNPSGVDLRYDSQLLLYDKIKEARRQDDDLPVGDWQHERKVADFATVTKLSQEAIATKTKDLQLGVWLTEALLHQEGFAGLSQGLKTCHELIDRFWDTLYPPVEDGDAELRAAPLNWLGTALEIPVKSVPLVSSGYDLLKYKESRLVGYEEHAQTDNERNKRAAMLAEGKLAPEDFDKAFAQTPKAFYVEMEKNLDACLAGLHALDKLCDDKFGDEAPSFSRLKVALEELRHTVHGLLEKKRELEPDPVDESAAAGLTDAEGAAPVSGGAARAAVVETIVIPLGQAEPPDRREIIASIAKGAALLRKREPHSPAPYLMMRGLRWGELRTSAGVPDAALMEAPSTELRQHIKRLALDNKWKELLEAAENAMSLPCSRAWLDLQHLVVVACGAMGKEYDAIATAITSELKNLIREVPGLLDANLLDGTPAANSDTKSWLVGLTQTAAPVPAEGASETDASESPSQPTSAAWIDKVTDPYLLSREAAKSGDIPKAFAIMRDEIARQRSGRGRFQRTLQMIQLCVEAGNDAIVQPLIDDVAHALENHKLDDWEDRQMVADALVLIMKTSKKVQADSSEQQRLFERVCRLDPVRALHAGIEG